MNPAHVHYPCVILWSVPDRFGETNTLAEAQAILACGGDAGTEGWSRNIEHSRIYRLEVAELPPEGDGLEIHGYGVGTDNRYKASALAVWLRDAPPPYQPGEDDPDGDCLSYGWLRDAIEKAVPL